MLDPDDRAILGYFLFALSFAALVYCASGCISLKRHENDMAWQRLAGRLEGRAECSADRIGLKGK